MLRGRWRILGDRRAKVATIRIVLDEDTLRRLEAAHQEVYPWLASEAALLHFCAEEGVYSLLNGGGDPSLEEQRS